MASPFEIQLYNKAFKRLGVLGAPVRLGFTPFFNTVGLGEIEVAVDDPNLAHMMPEGARVRVLYKGDLLMSGPVRSPTGNLAATGTVTFEFEDDYRLMRNTLALVMPTSSVRSGGLLAPLSLTDHAQAWTDAAVGAGLAAGSGYYRFPSTVSTAEAAIKDLITKNMVTRLGRPVIVAADQGRGGDARTAGMLPDVRMLPLDEAVASLLEWSGLGLKFEHDGVSAGITAEVWQPNTWPMELTVAGGTVTDGTWARQDPEATRIVVGGPGEDVSRAFWDVRDSTGLEAKHNDIIEVFRDATGASLTWPDALSDAYRVAKYYLLRSEVSTALKTEFTAYLNAAGRKGLADGAPKSGLSLTLSETEQFSFGPGGYERGDLITVVSNGATFSERITSADLAETATAGVTVTPQVGERTDDPDRVLAEAIARLGAAQRRLSTNR